MERYPFLIRGPTRRRLVHATGHNYYNALEKVLAVYPAKFVNYKNARNMDMNTTKQLVIKLSKKAKGVEHTIWLNEKEGEFYVTYLKDKFTMLVEEETDPVGVEIGSARTNKWTRESVWVNGNQIADSVTDGADGIKVEKISAEAENFKGVKISPAETKNSKGGGPKNKKEVVTETMAAAESANMKANKKNGKAAAKKPAANGSKVELKTVTGDKKTLTVKAILALQKKGVRVYRQSNPNSGGILIQKRLVKYSNQEKEIAVIVAKAEKV